MNLTKPQKLIYDMEKVIGGSVSTICGSMLICTDKSVGEIQIAVNKLYEQNDSLRTRIFEDNSSPKQYIEEYAEQNIEILHFESKKEFDVYASEYTKKPFDFSGPLSEIKIVVLPDKKGIIAKLHHIISDAWTLSLLCTQFNKLLNGENVRAFSYTDYINEEETYVNSKRYIKDKEYFVSQVQSCDEVVYISEKQDESFEAKRASFLIEKERFEKISDFEKKHDTSVFSLFLSAIAIYMSKTKNKDKFFIGTSVLNRRGVKDQNTMGMFVNTVPVFVQLSNEKSFFENLSNITSSALSVLRHQKYNYGSLLYELREKYNLNKKLYDVILNYQNAKVVGDNFETTWYHSGMQSESLQINIDDRDSDNCLKVNYDYRVDKFNEGEINALHNYILNLLCDCIENPNKKVAELEMLSSEEKQKVLYDFNETSSSYPKDKCIHELFEEQAEKTPDKTALVAADKTLTYRELNEEANRIANSLIEKGIGRGDIVGILLPRRSYFLSALFGVLKTGAAYLPLDPEHPEERIRGILRESNAKICISEDNIFDLLDNHNSDKPVNSAEPDNLCYCIYTSGSTGAPKGTLLYHRNLVWYMSVLKDIYGTDNINMPFFTSQSVDLSVPTYYLPVLTGGTVYLYNGELKENLIDIFNNENLTVLKFTPTHMSIICKLIPDKLCKNVRYVIVGGETLYTQTAVEFLDKFGKHIEIHNDYGPTETTVSCTDYIFDPQYFDGESYLPIGAPISNAQVYILDKYMNPVPIGVAGEICIAGDGVGAGYLGRPDLTAEKFIDNPFGEGKMYRTGDNAYWREDGNIVFIGRSDFQVKIRGLRIELGEIETAIQAIEGIERAVVVVRKDSEARQLICAFYTGKDIPAKTLREEIGRTLPKYMIPHIFTHLEKMPLTSSGKANRNALPEIDLENISTDTEYVAPETEKEKLLTECICDILKAEKVSVLDNFFDIGGDSLKAIELTARLEEKGYTAAVKTIFSCKNIRELAGKLEEKEQLQSKIEYSSIMPATSAQMRVYTAQMQNPDGVHYNIPHAFKTENLDPKRLEISINKLIQRHESFRTHFENREGTVVQVVDGFGEVKVQMLPEEDISLINKPFVLDESPLIRVGYCRDTVMLVMHHIITDGESMPIFFRELNELYMGRSLPDTVQYGEFAVSDGYSEENEKYWLEIFNEEMPTLELPTDYARASHQSFAGSNIYEQIDKRLHERIEEKCKEAGITPYVYYMACFSILLNKLSGSEDIVSGTPISGRSSRYLNTVGMFVNTIALRSKPEGNKTVAELLSEIRDSSIEAMDNQVYPFGELVKRLGINTAGRNPLFDVMFTYQSERLTDIVFADRKAEMLSVPLSGAKCDLSFYIMPRKTDIVLLVEYSTDLFREKRIGQYTKMYISLLEQCLDDKKCIKDISVTDTKLISSFNATKSDYAKDKCIHELFEEQAEKTPDKTALVAADKTLTYRELNEEANRIANSLIEKGIGRGDIVGLMLPRKSYLLSALFGILKTGAAYLPIDSELPAERIEYMCRDTDARLVISDENIEMLLAGEKTTTPCVKMTNDALCYCIYTSGSTGQPKAVMARHRNVVNYISKSEHNIAGKVITDDFEAIVSISTCSFDIFITETVLPLVNGLRTVLADEQQCRNQYALNKLLSKEKGEFLQTTPTKFKVLTADPTQREFLKNVKAIMLGGEAMERSYLRELRKITNAKIYNIYGATEVPIWSTFADTETFTDAVTIGKPIANTQVYILDKYLKPVPIGVTGELCIAGDSVSAGYLGRPELTAEKFIDNPFGEGKMYRTGDNAYWREDGNIVFIGRSDFQVKIRGLRIELGEIETAIQAIEGIERAVVVVRKDSEARQLICAFYTGEVIPAKTLREEIGRTLPKYMIPHIFTHLEKMPLTSSGKANRNALPEIDLENISTDTEYVAPETEKEKLLTECICDILKAEKVSVLDNFFDIGGDSLKAIELTARLEEKGYTAAVKTIFSCKNIRELAGKLEEKEQLQSKIEYSSIMPATSAQMRVYTAQMLKPDSTMYNITYAFKTEQVNKDRLERAINKLIERHESLRTRFENRDGQIVQIIEGKAETRIEYTENPDSFVKAFDLGTAPLVRVGCNADTVVASLHHIITDGESMPVFFRELNELYMGRSLPDTVQYGEFAVSDGYSEENEKYWLEIFNEEIPTLELPTDYARASQQSFAGSNIYEQIDKRLHERIEEKCKEAGITPYVYYMACFSILLSKLSGSEDIVSGTPISGRSSRYLNTVGMFVNTIALRSKPEGNKTVAELLSEIRDSSIEAMDNQVYPFGELVKRLGINTAGRNPLFDVMFAYQNFKMTDITFGDEKAELIPLETKASKCDMTFNVLPRTDDVVLAIEYCTDLFSERRIAIFAQMYISLLEQCIDDSQLITDLSVTDKSFAENLNATDHTYAIPENATLYSLFEKTAKENREKVCIKTAEKALTYGELLNISEKLDANIRSITQEKSVIAVIAERSTEMYGAIYGIIRGGNAYLPIDPDYPQDRIDYILQNSGAKAVVAQGKFTDKASDIPCIDMTEIINKLTDNHTDIPSCNAEPDDTAYVIYTSGSTGTPKGAKVSHRSAVNRILWMHDKYPLSENDVILQKTPYTFDVSVWELFWWGMCGGCLAVSKPGEHFLPAKILDEVARNKVTHLHFVPSVFEMFLNYLESHREEVSKFDSVRYVFLSGEALTAGLVERFYKLYDYNKVTLHNLYGPTECAVDVTYYDCTPEDADPVPIGKPIYNTQIHILDKYLKPVPIGVTGELCIAGMNVGQGYLNNPELTAEKFIDNPFGEGKMYRTGDNAYWREDGNIIFCGRKDSQIKLNGQRIETGEIESVISTLPEVQAVAVLVKEINKRDTLVAFYSGEKDIEPKIKEYCRDKLPKYMIPTFVVHLDKMPLNPNGKLDRRTLSEYKIESAKSTDKEPAANETERVICEAFSSVLGEKDIHRNTDFFDAGGTSLSMISVLGESIFENVSAAEFMRNPTPALLASLLKEKSVNKAEYIEALYVSETAKQVLVLIPFAGGGAEAYSNLVASLKKTRSDISVYFIRYLHSIEECENAANEVAEIFKGSEIMFYSHCVGSAVALQIIAHLEKKNVSVKHYFAGASIPPQKPSGGNMWNKVPDFALRAILKKAGSEIHKLRDKDVSLYLKRFREDTDFANVGFCELNCSIDTPVSLIISKTDMFTKKYKQAEHIWGIYAKNVTGIKFVDTDSHYFQNNRSDELISIIFG